jgi:hypothetical protein
MGGVEWHHPPDVIDLGGAAATAGLTHVFPLSTVVAVTSLSFHLHTAVNVATRQVTVQLKDGLDVLTFGVAAPGTQGSGLDVNYSAAPMLQAAGSSALGFQTMPFPGGRLPYNMELVIAVANAVAGDVISKGRLLVQQWPVRE